MSALDSELINLFAKSAYILNPVTQKTWFRNDVDWDSSFWLNNKDFSFFGKDMHNFYGPVSQYDSGKVHVSEKHTLNEDSSGCVVDKNCASQGCRHLGESLNSYNYQGQRTNQCISNNYHYQDMGYEQEWTCPYFGYSYNLDGNQTCNQTQGQSDYCSKETQVCRRPVQRGSPQSG